MSTVPTTIEEAAAACRAAFAAHPDAEWAWCCHHEERLERLMEPAVFRIAYILSDKPKHEQVTRLNNFRPVLGAYPQVWRESEAVSSILSRIQTAKDRWTEAKAALGAIPAHLLNYKEVSSEYRKASNERDSAYVEHHEAVEDYYREFGKFAAALGTETAHRMEVPHHTWNGKDIF